MIYGYPTEFWIAGGIALVLIAAVAYGWYKKQRRKLEKEIDQLMGQVKEANRSGDSNEIDGDPLMYANPDEALDIEDDREPDPGHEIELEPPDVGSSLLGLLSMWRHRAKATKLANKGYVKWHKIGARRHRPTWVKPELKGAGEPEYYDSDDECTYLFPEDAMVPDGATGAWVAEHRVGEVEPINLREPMAPALDADRLEEVINLEAESEAPGFFDRLNISSTTLMWLLIGGGFLVFAGMRYMGGA